MAQSDIMEFLRRKVGLFKDLPETQLGATVRASRITTIEPNEAIIEFGEEGRFLGILLDGEAEVSVAGNSGRRFRLASLMPGDIFGEMAVMTGDKTAADVIGLKRCRVMLIPESVYSNLLVSHPPAVRFLSRLIAERSRTVLPDEIQRERETSSLRSSEDPYGFRLKTDQPEKILVINCGSSSLKYNLYDTANEAGNARGMIERIGQPGGMRHVFTMKGRDAGSDLPPGGHREAFAAMLSALTSPADGVLSSPSQITSVGHRVVHGGERFAGAELIDDTVLHEIEILCDLAPLHNPVNLAGIREAQAVFPDVPHVAVFDTCFHHTLPPYAYLYGLPHRLYEEKRVRRYGFHGSSHFYVALKASEFLHKRFNELEIVSCHLGNGASLCAVDHGRSVDTTMGLTPAEGLIMGTRCGDIDPAVLIHLMRSEKMDAAALERMIQKESGLLGMSGISSDMREIQQAADNGDHRALLAFKTFCYRVRKYIGAYVAAMGGIDVLVFTGGIGQGSCGVRSLACQGLSCLGVVLDEEKNRQAASPAAPVCVSTDSSPVKVLVIPTDEERMIARETLAALRRQYITKILSEQKQAPIPIEVSAHHVHLSQEHVEALFGPGATLTPESDLSQPGQFACKEKVDLVGPRGRVERVRVLGPVRKATQVEISMTEQFKLGIHPPVRESGDIDGTPGLVLEGPKGKVTLDKGVICALRHIHMPPEDALRLGLRDKFMVRVRVQGDRELIFGDVLVRVNPNYKLAMHIDTDEANAAHLATGAVGNIDGIQNRGA